MADNYYHFSFQIELNSPELALEAAEAIDSSVEGLCDTGEEAVWDEIQEAFDSEDREPVVFQGITCRATEEGNLAFISESGHEDPYGAVLLAQAVLKRNDVLGNFGMTWATTCSRPRLNEFSGGAIVFNKEEIDSHDSDIWMHERLKTLGEEDKDGGS